jgi:poly(hydroxyalkanoate) depolymerase family esterase
VVLHGCTQTALEYSTDAAWDTLAQKHKFYVVYAEQKLANNSSYCFNYWEAANCSRNQGEALSIKQMTDYMRSIYSIDNTRVFVTGLSAGGAMTAVMLSVYPDVFNAGAVMSGLPYNPLVSLDSVEYAMLGDISHTPQQWGNIVREAYPGYTGSYPRLSIFQGTADAVVNIENSHELIKQFTNLHSCDTIADYTNTSFNGNNLIQLQQYFDSTNHVAVQFYQVSNMAHGIAVYPGTCFQRGGTVDEFSFNESFYSSFWAAQFFGILHLPFSMAGFDTVTVNQQGLVYSVPVVSGATYTWIVPAGVSIVSGQGTNSITVNWGTASGTINLSETLSGGCIKGPAQIFVTAIPAPPTLDAALSSLSSPGSHVCGDSIVPGFTLGNSGQATLTSSMIYYQVDNGLLHNYTWSGSLATSQTAAIVLPAITLSPGNHTLLIYCDSPNGGTDINPANDTLRGSFTSGVAPIVNLGSDTAQCGGIITINAQNSGSSFAWSTGSTAQTITVSQTNIYSVTVTNAQSCSASGSVHVRINSAPVVTLQLLPDTVCESGGLITLGGGNPGGGVYAGNNISNGIFNPSAAGYGNFLVSYNYSDSNSCHGAASQNIYVVPCSTAIGVSDLTSPVDTVCAASVTPSFTLTNLGQTNIYTATIYYELDNGSVQNYTWSGNLAGGHSTVVNLPVISIAPGNHTIIIFCMDTVRSSFTIGSVPVVNLGNDTAQCGGGITLNAQNNGAIYSWSTGAVVQSITVTQTGMYVVTVTNLQTCSASDSVLVSIDTVPVVTLQLSADTVCSNGSPVSLNGSPAGGTFTGPDVHGGQFNPATAGSGNYVISYTYTDSNNCHASVSQNIKVETCAAIANVPQAPEIHIFPNPNGNGWLTISVDAQYLGKPIFIFDATGRMVKQYLINAESEQFNISILSAGIYLVQIGEQFKKLVVE